MAKKTFEKIKPWDGVSGTGADARGVIERNFEKVNDGLGELDNAKLGKADEVAPIITPLGDVTNFADLPANSPYGHARKVTSEGVIYSSNGTNWKSTGFRNFPNYEFSTKATDYAVRYRKNKQLTYDPTTLKLKVIGHDAVNETDLQILNITVDGIVYAFNGAVNSELQISVGGGNCQLCIEKSTENTTIELSDIVAFNDVLDRSGTHIKLAHITYNDGITSYLIKDYRQCIPNLRNYANPIYNYNVRFKKDKQLTYDPVSHKLKVIGSDSSYPTDLEIFDITVDGINYGFTGAVNSELQISVEGGNCQLCIEKSTENTTIELSDIVVFNDALDHSNTHIKLAHITYNDGISSHLIKDYRQCIPNLRNYASPIYNYNVKYRKDKQLTYDPVTSKIKVIGSDAVQQSDLEIFTFEYDGIFYTFKGSVNSEIEIPVGGGHSQLCIEKYESNTQLGISDIVVFNDTLDHSATHIKLAHLIYNDGLTSYLIKDYRHTVENSYDSKKYKTAISADVDSLKENYNYNKKVVIGGNIGEDGILGTYPGRGAFFYRLKDVGAAEQVNGCTVLTYQWYSSEPEYVKGTNCLCRTTGNTPPLNAMYCGLNISTEDDFSNITITNNKERLQESASLINNSFGENCFANGLRSELKILAFGNSFMRNSAHYLSAIAGGCGVNLTVGNLYTGGTNLADHYNAIRYNENVYLYNRYENGINTVELAYQTARAGILDKRWDVVILHQYVPWLQPFEPYLNLVMKQIIDMLGYCPKFYLNSTWAGHEDYVQEQYGFATEVEMWQYMLNSTTKACGTSGINVNSIIPTGTAMQNARALSFADDFFRYVNSGGDWHHLNCAGGFIAACTIYEKIIYPLNGVHCSSTTFRIPVAEVLPPGNVPVDSNVIVTNANYLDLCQSAIKAVENPKVV